MTRNRSHDRLLRVATRCIRHLRILAFFIPLIAALAVAGLQVRKWAWDQTVATRFNGDIANGFARGDEADRIGFVNAYQEVANDPNGDYGLDYTPLRLYVMTLWARWRHVHFPDVHSWGQIDENRFPLQKYELTRPLLLFNTACEAAAAIVIFLLIRLWVKRYDRRSGIPPKADAIAPPLYRGSGKGLLGAALFWFNAAIIQDAHCWPQWDVWCIPFYLLAILLASLDWFFAAGFVAAIGAMFKGQLLLVAPIFALWPLMQGRAPAALRAVTGFALGLASVGAVWLLAPMPARLWLATLVAAVVVARPWSIFRKWRPALWIAATVAAGLIAWPFFRLPLTIMPLLIGVLGAAAVVLLARTLRWRAVPYLIAGLLACGAFLSAPVFNANMAWWKVGVAYGTRHYPHMSIGELGSLASWLERHFGWNIDDPLWTGAPIPGFVPDGIRQGANAFALQWTGPAAFLTPVTIRSFLFATYIATLLLCSWGAARQSRRGDVRFLAAIAAPWILFFAILPQMHERYLLWAAGITAVAAGVGWGMTLMHLVVTLAAWFFIANNSGFARLAPETWPWLRPDGPMQDISWLVAAAAATFLIVGLMARPRRIQAIESA